MAFSLAIVVLGLACTPTHSQSTFDAAGPVAEKQLNLFLIIFWAAVVVFVTVEGALVYTAIKYRRRTANGVPKQIHGSSKLEIAWTIAPALILVVIAIPTISTIYQTAGSPTQGPVLQVNVTAHQWWWEFEYPGLGVVTANELHVPPEPWAVEATLASQDVIHSFWVPKLAGKVDMIPNHANKIWFSAKEPGTYYGQCAEFCGVAHAQMRFRVIVEPTQAAFDEWVAAQKVSSAPVVDGLAKQGQLVFGIKGCGICHTVSGPDPQGLQQTRMDAFLSGAPMFPAPNLTHFASRFTLAGGLLDNTQANLSEWLRSPEDVKAGNRMSQFAGPYKDPDLALSDEEIAALVAYLESLK